MARFGENVVKLREPAAAAAAMGSDRPPWPYMVASCLSLSF